MIETNYNPDVLNCLANLSNDEVFTPPKLVNEILDLLPAELWEDKNAKFLDPVCKTGVFLREIAKRLNEGLKRKIPDQQERLDHIYSNQLYGIAITELTSLVSRRSLYCSKKANGKYSVCSSFKNDSGNIRFKPLEHTWKNGKCLYCGASEEVYSRDEALESHAYELIHTDKPENIFNMKFDVIIGNPPYQLDTGGSGRQAKPIYQKFVTQAKSLNPSYLIMIIPSRWFAGGMGLNEFREIMLNDHKMKIIVDYPDARECFPNVDIAGGVCYFLWDKSHNGLCEFRSIFKGKNNISSRKLNEFSTLIRYEPAVSILRKIESYKEKNITDLISSVRPFGLKTSDRPSGKGNLTLISSGGDGKIEESKVTAGQELIKKWKIMTSKTSHDHGGQPDKDGSRRVLSRIELLKPNEVCTESYILLGAFTDKNSALNLLTYAKTKFFRFLVSLLSFSQDITRERFVYVPNQDFTKTWNDKELYLKYKLTKDEIDFIESMIRPME